MDIEGYPELVPQEIGLVILASNGPRVPQIIQLLDWQEEPERYITVLERPPHCENLIEFLDRHRGTIKEDVASVIIKQATLAAQTCCQRGVLHRDIKLENLLINPDTLDIKIIDFGCGEILTDAGYTSVAEYEINREYHGEPATVWSLGMLMFAMLCGKFPESEDLDELDENTWTSKAQRSATDSGTTSKIPRLDTTAKTPDAYNDVLQAESQSQKPRDCLNGFVCNIHDNQEN
ncbi:serine/threonine-protein kinase pim-2-like [Megalobrama amblycephala]|uniref:serine/threonine-protein kinase pim-2-like n=1 Tax=Megalobrama amblycephala TaxID=75352 RepID=UPI0020142E40|nr:serine/threonine-protein kinase pim-2-like [Megalobrama amblycephala]